MKKLSIIILVLTLSVTNIYAAGNKTETDSGNKREQRKLQKQSKILRALDILQSGKFKFLEPSAYHDRFGGYWLDDWRGSCNISHPDYKIISTDIDTVKSMYTLVYSNSRSSHHGHESITTVEYNFKTGYLKAIRRIDNEVEGGVISNYSCIYALNEEPRR